jgi:hypothetical protein
MVEKPIKASDSKIMSAMLSVDYHFYDKFLGYQNLIEDKVNNIFSDFEPVKYSTEKFNGMFYYIKYRISDDEWGYLHVRIHEPEGKETEPVCQIVTDDHTLEEGF